MVVDEIDFVKNLKDIREEYKKLQQKYKLPDFDALDNDFEIRKIPAGLFILKEIRRILVHKLDGACGLLEPVVNPSESMHSAIESKAFDKNDLEAVFNFYKRLHHLIHKGISTTLENEAKEVEWINEVWKAWPEIKKELQVYVKKITDSWAKAEKETFSDKYLG